MVLSDVNRRFATEAAGLRLFLLPRDLRVASHVCEELRYLSCGQPEVKRSKEKQREEQYLWFSARAVAFLVQAIAEQRAGQLERLGSVAVR